MVCGISWTDYKMLVAAHAMDLRTYSATSNALSVASGRISYVYGLAGASLSVDTACSSSLVASHVALAELRAGTSSGAVVGGVNLTLAVETSGMFAKAGMLSPDGRCKTLDARANGYARSEGVGSLVLRPCGEAQQAVVRLGGSAVRQDGRSASLTAPNGSAQRTLLGACLR